MSILSVIVENRPVRRQYRHRTGCECASFMLASVPNAVNATLYDKLNFNFIRDIAPGRPCQAGIFASSSGSRKA
jgi:hypothetical protein